MIVNDYENKKTLDTETGVYLTQGSGSARDSIYGFLIVDGETRIYFSTTRSLKKVSDKNIIEGTEKKYDLKYLLDSVPLFSGGPPKRKNYQTLIETLLVTYCVGHGDGGGSTEKLKLRLYLRQNSWFRWWRGRLVMPARGEMAM